MIGNPATPAAYKLFHEGAVALSQVECNGITIDVEYLDKKIQSSGEKIQRMTKVLKRDPIYHMMVRKFGRNVKLGSKDKLASVIFVDMGLPCKNWTEGRINKETGEREKRPKADDQALRDTKLPFCIHLLKMEKLKNARTKLMGIRRELQGNKLRPFFNLGGGTADDKKGDPRSYRSSADLPNVHNFPTRDEGQARLVRTAVIPETGDILIEADFKGLEVFVGYCYHLDPVMRKYLLDKTTDMHRDVAVQCYKLEEEEGCDKAWWDNDHPGGGGKARYVAKNKFTFPQFYGDYWMNCAKNMWEDIDRYNLCTPSGVPMKEHLKNHGINQLGSEDPKAKQTQSDFTFHIRQVEDNFWNVRFKVYKKWKDKWYKKYCERGWFQMKTGFVCSGMFNRKQVINYPVQGAAFHCLLWCLIRLQKWLNKNKMKTKIVSQIHDSIILNAPKNEVHEVVAKLRKIMKEELLKAWDWIVIPLEVSIDVTDTNWFQKQKYEKFYGVAA